MFKNKKTTNVAARLFFLAVPQQLHTMLFRLVIVLLAMTLATASAIDVEIESNDQQRDLVR